MESKLYIKNFQQIQHIRYIILITLKNLAIFQLLEKKVKY